MNASPFKRLAAVVAALGAGAVLAAPPALADPPNYQRHLPQAQTGLLHQPEILSGLGASPEGRLSPRPEVIGGISSPGFHVAVSASQPSARGFNWGDAGIGGAIALAATALALGCALAVRKRVSLAH